MSLTEQRERVEQTCEREGWPLVAFYEEQDVSGQRPLARRAGLLRAVQDIEGGRATVLVVAYFDRLCRSLKTQAEVVERVEAAGGRVYAVDAGEITNGSAAGWLSASVLGMMNEYYARSAGERLRESKQRNIDRGVPPFPRITPAYRRRPDGRLEPDPVKAPIIREAIAMRLAGTSWTRLTRWLNEQGIAMSPSGLEAMFSSKLLIGEIHFGDFAPNLNAVEEPIIDRATFRQLQKAKAPRGRYANSQRLLARLGILRCASCDSRMTVDTARRGGGKRLYSYYRCGNRLCSAPAIVSCDVADQVVRDEAIRLSAEVVGRASAEAELEQARLHCETAEAKLANAIRTLAGLGGEAATREVLEELQAERDAAVDEHQRLASLTSPDVTLRTTDDWDRLSFDGKRDVIRAVVARATVAPGRGPGRITVDGRVAAQGK